MQTDTLKTLVINTLEELKARDVAELDVASLTSVTDTMIVASGTSNRHVGALAESVVESVKEAGHRPLGIEGRQGSDWVLVDLGELVVHVMLPETRQQYDLERLWSDLPSDGTVAEEMLGGARG